jgi:hypothetical protein
MCGAILALAAGAGGSAPVEAFDGLSATEGDAAANRIVSDYETTCSNLITQLRLAKSDEARTLLIYALGELRAVRAAEVIVEHIDLKPPRRDLALKIARWGPFPAVEALTKIGRPAVNEILAKLQRDVANDRLHLMVEVIFAAEGAKCGRILIENEVATYANDPKIKANLEAALDAFDAMNERMQQDIVRQREHQPKRVPALPDAARH